MPAPEFFYILTVVLPILAVALTLWTGGWLRRVYLISVRLLLGAFMLSAGLYKLSDNQIPWLMGPPMNHTLLAKYGLQLFAQFIGVAQLIIGLLLLTGRFALLGALMLVPIWAGIIMFTWSQDWQGVEDWRGTPSLVCGFLILTLGLLLHDYHRLKYVLYPPAQPETIRAVPLRTGPRSLEALWWLGVAIFMGGSLLYPVSLRVMVGTMLAGLLLLLAAGGLLLWRRRRTVAEPVV
ncbi:DoxX family membrane protein [Hymenobacter yonginensis]|uniref:DoxX family membrane protein n=1 Tax=Hymenobacter yonginensis TaxID=748197 RepID=A0ABY7PQ55_9BACT|nr:DoxX family membrane protein [Hymenobacter yonginensis]WBO84864.1 DoxX family membrane protein [Hymenobacter yonginensis]